MKVRTFVSELAFTYRVCFTTAHGQEQEGRSYSFNSQEDVIAVIRRAHANLETINIAK